MAAHTNCMQETEATITSHIGLSHQDMYWIISMPKLISPEIEKSPPQFLYVHFITVNNVKEHTK